MKNVLLLATLVALASCGSKSEHITTDSTKVDTVKVDTTKK
jgi:hypothetical protein